MNPLQTQDESRTHGRGILAQINPSDSNANYSPDKSHLGKSTTSNFKIAENATPTSNKMHNNQPTYSENSAKKGQRDSSIPK